MASRSTRNKLKSRFRTIDNSLTNIQSILAELITLTGGRFSDINEYSDILFYSVEELKKAFSRLGDRL